MKAWIPAAALALLGCADEAAAPPTPPVATDAARAVVLAYQNNVNGDIEPCG